MGFRDQIERLVRRSVNKTPLSLILENGQAGILVMPKEVTDQPAFFVNSS